MPVSGRRVRVACAAIPVRLPRLEQEWLLALSWVPRWVLMLVSVLALECLFVVVLGAQPLLVGL